MQTDIVTFQYNVASVDDLLEGTQREILDLIKKYTWKYGERDLGRIKTGVEEALRNAYFHGNLKNPSSIISISGSISKEKFVIEITDQGKGFDLDQVPDPTLDENLGNECGRGIQFMRGFMDVVEYNDTGNKVRLEKRRTADQPVTQPSKAG